MAETTFEEAKRCPRCKFPGEETAVLPGDRGSKVHTLVCRTPGCPWENTNWIVQVQRDGSIPLRKTGDKDFPELPMWAQNQGRRMVELVEHELDQGEITDER